MIYFDLREKFNDTYIIYVDSSVKPINKLVQNNFVIWFDNEKQIKCFNYFGKLNFNNNYGLVDTLTEAKLKEELLAIDPEFKFNNVLNFALGKIEKRTQHPKSEKLAILQVDFGNFKKQIITNTTYTIEDKYFPFILNGSINSQGLEITEGEIMNEKSQGMLASLKSFGFRIATDEENQIFFDYLNKNYQKYFGLEILDKVQITYK
ncbi:TyrS-associated PheT N-terminal domain-related protein TapR [Mycoplasmopsis gallinarum]